MCPGTCAGRGGAGAHKAQQMASFSPSFPAKAGIHFDSRPLDSRFRGNDGHLQGLCPGFHRPRSSKLSFVRNQSGETMKPIDTNATGRDASANQANQASQASPAGTGQPGRPAGPRSRAARRRPRPGGRLAPRAAAGPAPARRCRAGDPDQPGQPALRRGLSRLRAVPVPYPDLLRIRHRRRTGGHARREPRRHRPLRRGASRARGELLQRGREPGRRGARPRPGRGGLPGRRRRLRAPRRGGVRQPERHDRADAGRAGRDRRRRSHGPGAVRQKRRRDRVHALGPAGGGGGHEADGGGARAGDHRETGCGRCCTRPTSPTTGTGSTGGCSARATAPTPGSRRPAAR